MMTAKRREIILGYLFISPWLIGLCVFILYPLIYNIYLGFTSYNGFLAPEWIGFDNYVRMFTRDSLFWTACWNTIYYTLFAVIVGVPFTILMALGMKVEMKETPVVRAILVIPSVLPVFALSLVFVWLLNPRFGLVNYLLGFVGIHGIDWLGSAQWSKFSLVLLAQLGAGQVALIYLAALQGIPEDLYDAARIDGANGWRRFWSITFPMITPVLQYQIIVGIGLGLSVFTQAYVMTNGGPQDSTLFYALYLYKQVFSYADYGYGAAMATVLFIVSLVLAVLVFRASAKRVHYEAVG
jgi:multiple sugar transport system permease protein